MNIPSASLPIELYVSTPIVTFPTSPLSTNFSRLTVQNAQQTFNLQNSDISNVRTLPFLSQPVFQLNHVSKSSFSWNNFFAEMSLLINFFCFFCNIENWKWKNQIKQKSNKINTYSFVSLPSSSFSSKSTLATIRKRIIKRQNPHLSPKSDLSKHSLPYSQRSIDSSVHPTQVDRYELPSYLPPYSREYGREYGRNHHHMQMAGTDTSVSWHSLLQLILLVLLSIVGTVGNIFIISGLTIIEHFQIPGK